MTAYVRRRRFKASPCQDGDYLRHVVPHVERNPVRAGLVEPGRRKLRADAESDSTYIERAPGPDRGGGRPMIEAEADAVSASIRRDRSFGSDSWARTTAEKIGLESSLRNRGRRAGRRAAETRRRPARRQAASSG